MKTIWIILRSSIHTRRPVMSVIQNLLERNDVKINLISIEPMGIFTENFSEYIQTVGIGTSLISKISAYSSFRQYINKILKRNLKEDDYIWIGSLDTINLCIGLGVFNRAKYICHIHELYDTNRIRLSLSKRFIQGAYKVVVPELNRARILQVWLELKEQPIVYPNKPWTHPRQKYMKPTTELTKKILSEFDYSKKIIIYQGHIGRDRSLNSIIQAIEDMDNVEFWLMGRDHNYVNELLAMSDKVKYLGFIPAPYHLEVTSYADIGIMSYDLINLNNLYCAPNKVWEYLGFDLFFICNQVGSLDEFNASGCCKLIDFSNVPLIRSVIENEIIKSHNFLEIYNKVNLKVILDGII